MFYRSWLNSRRVLSILSFTSYFNQHRKDKALLASINTSNDCYGIPIAIPGIQFLPPVHGPTARSTTKGLCHSFCFYISETKPCPPLDSTLAVVHHLRQFMQCISNIFP